MNAVVLVVSVVAASGAGAACPNQQLPDGNCAASVPGHSYIQVPQAGIETPVFQVGLEQEVQTINIGQEGCACAKNMSLLVVSPVECQPFCLDHGCTCLLDWTERCKVRSCAGCVKCESLETPTPAPPAPAPKMGRCEMTAAGKATCEAARAAGVATAKPCDVGVTGSYRCDDPAAAAEQCASEGLHLCTKAEMKTHFGDMCAFMYTSDGGDQGCMLSQGTPACGGQKPVGTEMCSTGSYNGNGMFNGACCA